MIMTFMHRIVVGISQCCVTKTKLPLNPALSFHLENLPLLPHHCHLQPAMRIPSSLLCPLPRHRTSSGEEEAKCIIDVDSEVGVVAPLLVVDDDIFSLFVRGVDFISKTLLGLLPFCLEEEEKEVKLTYVSSAPNMMG